MSCPGEATDFGNAGSDPATNQVWTDVFPVSETLKAHIISHVSDAKIKAKISHKRVFEGAVLRAILSLLHEPSDEMLSQLNNAVSLQVHESMRQRALDLQT